MARYEINGGRPLNGTVDISGAKNAVVAILPAALLVKGKCAFDTVRASTFIGQKVMNKARDTAVCHT